MQPGQCCSRLDKTAFMKTLTEVPWMTQAMLPEFTEMGRRQSSQELIHAKIRHFPRTHEDLWTNSEEVIY